MLLVLSLVIVFLAKKNHVIGKIFKEQAFLVSGEIIGKVKLNENYVTTAPTKEQVAAAWDILAGISKHTSDWITEKNTWASVSFKESLS